MKYFLVTQVKFKNRNVRKKTICQTIGITLDYPWIFLWTRPEKDIDHFHSHFLWPEQLFNYEEAGNVIQTCTQKVEETEFDDCILVLTILYQFAITAVMTYHKLSVLNKRNLLSVSQLWRSKIKVWVGLVLPEGSKQESVPCLLPSVQWFPGHLWHSQPYRTTISAFTFTWCSHYVYVQISPFIRTRLILNSQPMLFQYNVILTTS